MSKKHKLDNIDEKIVRMLSDNARLSYTEIADAIGLARPSVKARIDTLEKSGKILGYETLLAEDADERITYMIGLSIHPYGMQSCLAKFNTVPDIKTVLTATNRSACTLICKSMTYDRANKIGAELKKFPGAKEESFAFVEVNHKNMFNHPAA